MRMDADPAIDSLVDGRASWELVPVEMLSRLPSDKTEFVAGAQKEKLSSVSAAED